MTFTRLFAISIVASRRWGRRAGAGYSLPWVQEHTEAYIVDKATALHASLSAQVTVSDDEIPIPVAVRLTGAVSPNVRRQMEDFIQEELGITRENQKWTG